MNTSLGLYQVSVWYTNMPAGPNNDYPVELHQRVPSIEYFLARIGDFESVIVAAMDIFEGSDPSVESITLLHRDVVTADGLQVVISHE